jgi:chromate transporter
MNTLTLFAVFFRIGLFSVGGGYAAMPLIQEQVVTLHGWLDMTGFGDIVAIAEMTPGPIAINAATFVGTQVAGLPGAIAATLGCVTPSCIIVLTLAWVYYRFRGLDTVQGILAGLRPAVVAMIGSAGLSLVLQSLWGGAAVGLENLDPIALVIFLVAFFVLRKWKPGPIAVMATSGLAGLVLYGVL